MTVTSEMIRQIRDMLGQSQRQFGETLWNAVHGSNDNGSGYTRNYVSMLERGKTPITSRIAQGVRAMAARLDGADEVQARARQACDLLAVNDLPAGTVILGHAQRCANPGCPVVFVPTHPRQKYHSRACAEMARKESRRRLSRKRGTQRCEPGGKGARKREPAKPPALP